MSENEGPTTAPANESAAHKGGPCPVCGYRLTGENCGRCTGTAMGVTSQAPITPGRGWSVVDLLHGFVTFFQGGLYLFNRPEFVGRLALPIAANLVVFGGLFVLLYLGFGSLFEWALSTEWVILDGLRTSVEPTGAVALTLATAMLLGPTLFEAATGAFFDPLADTAERLTAGDGMQPESTTLWAGMVRGLRDSAQLLVIELTLLVPVWGLALVPVVGIPLVFLLASAIAAVVWFEVPFARRGYGLVARLRVLKRNWARALGFGMAFQVAMLVPIFDALLLTPAAAVGASLLYFHFEKGDGAG